VKGFNVISLWPDPSTANVGTINISYEPRLIDWNINIADTTGTASVMNASQLVTNASTTFTPSMVNQWFTVTDGTGGNWYQIIAVPNSSTLTLANFYQDQTNNTASYLIGTVPDVPEDYHMAFVYYPVYQFQLKRGNIEAAEAYLGMFNDLLRQYEETYSNKRTGVVQTKQRGAVYSVFGIPPTNISQ
jgi:hypothetical protein